MTSLLPFRWHLIELLVIGVSTAGLVSVIGPWRQRRLALYAMAALALATLWPLGDLAASVSLTAATVQRLLIMLLVAPLLLLSLPVETLARLTRPAGLDALTRRLAHPGFAIAVVTVVGTATLSTPIVDWGARSSLGRAIVLLVVLVVGVILWLPALRLLPGTRHLSPMARAGYVFVSSLVVTSLSFVWIFARHPLYPALHHQLAILHMTPLFDQQLAGFVSKFGAYAPMWGIAFVIFSRAEDDGTAIEETPLHWADVEREMLRIDRLRTRQRRRAEQS